MADSGGSLRILFSSAFVENRTWAADQSRSAAPLLTHLGSGACIAAVEMILISVGAEHKIAFGNWSGSRGPLASRVYSFHTASDAS
jgi:hypothetical protein